ncbi:MAG: hypothetical protein JXA94_07495 [Parachlamydiales bacterium]|nr:hypothetical protein [Parachlamydiales bacterium]
MIENYQDVQVFRFNQVFFQKNAHKNFGQTLSGFKKILKSFAIFNIGFIFLFFSEIVTFAILFSYLTSSGVLAILLGSIFLTAFTYFVLLFYFQSKKHEQITSLKDKFIVICKRALCLPIGAAEHHLTVAHALIKLKENVDSFEQESVLFKNTKFISPIFKKISSYLHKEDFFKFKEMLVLSAIEEHIEQIQHTPTDLEVHASLSNAYTILSSLYLETKNQFFSKAYKSEFEQKYTFSIKCTIEEFKILNDYAPNDPWIHLQLASNYKKLSMQKEEIAEYETVNKLCPNDNNVLHKLGVLYFEMGKNSKGLRVYEELKSRSDKNADSLLKHYGIFNSDQNSQESL